MGYKFILFDIDDTLLYTSKNAYKKHCRICEKVWFPITDKDVYFSYYWKKTISEVANILIPNISSDLYLEYYKQAWLIIPYEGIYHNVVNIFKALKAKGYEIGILTNWNEEKTMRKLKFLGIKNQCSLVYHGGNMKYKKPSPKVFDWIKDILNWDVSRVVYVWDSLEDYYAASWSGIVFYAVLTWYTNKELFINAWLNKQFIYNDIIGLLDNL